MSPDGQLLRPVTTFPLSPHSFLFSSKAHYGGAQGSTLPLSCSAQGPPLPGRKPVVPATPLDKGSFGFIPEFWVGSFKGGNREKKLPFWGKITRKQGPAPLGAASTPVGLAMQGPGSTHPAPPPCGWTGPPGPEKPLLPVSLLPSFCGDECHCGIRVSSGTSRSSWFLYGRTLRERTCVFAESLEAARWHRSRQGLPALPLSFGPGLAEGSRPPPAEAAPATPPGRVHPPDGRLLAWLC